MKSLSYTNLLVVIVSAVFIAVPYAVIAENHHPETHVGDCRYGEDNKYVGGLVPCGCDTNGDGVVDDEEQCSFKHLLLLANNIITWLIMFALMLAAVMFVFAGFLYMSAQGDENKVKQAHSIFRNVLIGLLVALAAWLIVYTITVALVDEESCYLQFLDSSIDPETCI